MTVDQVMEMFNTLKAAYPRMEQFDDDNVKKVWLTAFEDLDGDIAMKAVWVCIRKYEFMPSIAQVINAYDELVKEEKKLRDTCNYNYKLCRGIYPKELEEGYGYKEFVDKVMTAKPEKRIEAAQYIYSHMNKVVYSGEEVPDFVEIIKGIK